MRTRDIPTICIICYGDYCAFHTHLKKHHLNLEQYQQKFPKQFRSFYFCQCEWNCGEKVKPRNRFIKGHNGRKSKIILVSKLCECNCGRYAQPGRKFIHGHNNGFKGKTCSEEAKQKNRLKHLGKSLSIETKEKLRIAASGNTNCLGRQQSEEEKIKRTRTANLPHNIERAKQRYIRQLAEGNIGWKLSGRGRESYPEKIFREFLESFGAIKNVDFFQNYPVGRYLLDFAYLDVKYYIEIDGSQHLEPKAIEHDKKRDKWLLGQGWVGLRIPVKKLKKLLFYWRSLNKQTISIGV